MTNKNVKKSVIYGVYSLGVIALIGTIYLVESSVSKNKFVEQDYSYVSKTIFDEVIPVIATEEKIMKPYTDEDVKILKGYYDYKGEESNQKNAIIYYQNTYMQSSGVSYGKSDTFDVLAILPGTVVDVKEDELLGNIVEIKHSDKVISVYQSLSEVNVKKNDTVIQGQAIGKSGTSNIQTDLGNHIYFELIVNGTNVNPEEYYEKTLKEIEGE